MDKSVPAKYPRIPHLPWSPGRGGDDKALGKAKHLVGTPLVITEKLDGSNICLTHTEVFARSHNGPPTHESFDWLKSFHASIKNNIEPGYSLFGEYCYAVHSIEYEALPTYFFLFGIRDEITQGWYSWGGTGAIAGWSGLEHVPELWSGRADSEAELERIVNEEMAKPSVFGGEREGIVVRCADVFPDNSFSSSIAKCVRANHVQTDEHWMNGPIRKQKLK